METDYEYHIQKMERFEKALKEDIRKINTGDETYTSADIDFLKNWYMTDFIESYKEVEYIPDNLIDTLKSIVEDTMWMIDM